MKYHLALSFSAIAVLLSACGGEPSGAEMRQAIEGEVANLGKGMGPFGGMMSVKILDVRKTACKKAEGKPGYVCDYQVDIENPMVGKKSDSGSARFVKGNKGWQVFSN